MSQLLSSADESLLSEVKRLQKFSYRRCDKKSCILLSLIVYLQCQFLSFYLYNTHTYMPATITTSSQSTSELVLETIHSFAHESLHWLNDPKLQGPPTPDPSGETPGSGGDYTVTAQELTLAPPAFRDFWSRTFYSPTLVKHDASALLRTVPYEAECTVALDFEVTPKTQFDQVGGGEGPGC
jgi:hypothetical protein